MCDLYCRDKTGREHFDSILLRNSRVDYETMMNRYRTFFLFFDIKSTLPLSRYRREQQEKKIVLTKYLKIGGTNNTDERVTNTNTKPSKNVCFEH